MLITTKKIIKSGLILMFIGILILISSTSSIANRASNTPSKSRLSHEKIEQIANMTTVRINTNGSQYAGSGVIISKKIIGTKAQYLVLSNAHVIDFGYREECTELSKERIIKIETYDSKIHTATIHKQSQSLCKIGDLALLQFSSDTNNQYEVVHISNSNNAHESEDIYVSGFPCDKKNCKEKINVQKGTISTKLTTEALKYGYKIGYNLKTKRGTSGGSLLNEYGELVGIHSRGPSEGVETEDDDEFNSSKSATPDEKTMMHMNAWAIPSELFLDKLSSLIKINNTLPQKSTELVTIISLNEKVQKIENELHFNRFLTFVLVCMNAVFLPTILYYSMNKTH
jgi:serine protease Do